MRNVRSFKIQWYLLVLLLVSLIASMALNVYLYFEAIKPSTEYGINTLIVRDIQGGMGTLAIAIEHRQGFSFTYEMVYVSVPSTFNISVMISLWAPYTGTHQYRFTVKLYERPLHGEYQNTPMIEKNVTIEKDKDTMYVKVHAILTVTAPPDPGIYIYKVAIEDALDYEVEFPILVELGGRVTGP